MIGDILMSVMAACSVIALVIGGIAWFHRRGGQEMELSIAVRDNTRATRELSGKFEMFTQVHKALEDRVDGHETRLTLHDEQIANNTRALAQLWPSPITVTPKLPE